MMIGRARRSGSEMRSVSGSRQVAAAAGRTTRPNRSRPATLTTIGPSCSLSPVRAPALVLAPATALVLVTVPALVLVMVPLLATVLVLVTALALVLVTALAKVLPTAPALLLYLPHTWTQDLAHARPQHPARVWTPGLPHDWTQTRSHGSTPAQALVWTQDPGLVWTQDLALVWTPDPAHAWTPGLAHDWPQALASGSRHGRLAPRPPARPARLAKPGSSRDRRSLTTSSARDFSPATGCWRSAAAA